MIDTLFLNDTPGDILDNLICPSIPLHMISSDVLITSVATGKRLQASTIRRNICDIAEKVMKYCERLFFLIIHRATVNHSVSESNKGASGQRTHWELSHNRYKIFVHICRQRQTRVNAKSQYKL